MVQITHFVISRNIASHSIAGPRTPASTRATSSVVRSEEHTSELQSLMRISYAVFCLKKKKKRQQQYINHIHTQQTRHTKTQHKTDNQILTVDHDNTTKTSI